MPALIQADVSAALIVLLAARSGLTGVQVTDGYPGDDIAGPERIWTGESRSTELEVAGLKTGRTFYQETAEIDIVVQVLKPGESPLDVKARVQVLGREVAQCVADNRTAGGVPGLNYVVGSRWTLNLFNLAAGTAGEFTYTVKYAARLT